MVFRAKAIYKPTLLLEPFGVLPYKRSCGTPDISTDWGAFSVTGLHGVTGYPCRTLDDFVFAL